MPGAPAVACLGYPSCQGQHRRWACRPVRRCSQPLALNLAAPSLIAAAITDEVLSTTWATGFTWTSAYRAVVATSAWPSALPTKNRLAPLVAAVEARLWRSVWSVTRSRPAPRQRPAKNFVMPVSARPELPGSSRRTRHGAQWSPKSNAASNDRGRIFAPVFVSARRSTAAAMSTSDHRRRVISLLRHPVGGEQTHGPHELCVRSRRLGSRQRLAKELELVAVEATGS